MTRSEDSKSSDDSPRLPNPNWSIAARHFVAFSESDDSETKTTPLPPNPLPSSRGSESLRDEATSRNSKTEPERLAPLLTVDEVANLLRMSSTSVYSMIERAPLPGVTRLGRRLLIRRDDLLRWLNERRASSKQERRP